MSPDSGTGARQAMIGVAERLVAERGVHAVSIRDVLRESGQRNKSAAHYHFGSLKGMLAAVMAERGAPIRASRDAWLMECGSSQEPRRLMSVLVAPPAHHVLRPGSYYARFLAQLSSNPELHVILREHQHTPGYLEVLDRLRKSLPEVPIALWQPRLDCITLMTINILARWEAEPPTGISTNALTSDLIDSALRVLAGPVSKETDQILRADMP